MSILDRCVFNATSVGTGNFVVANAVTGYQTPSQANASNGFTYHYAAQTTDASGNITAWEVGTGAYTTATSTLARSSILFSSNSNSIVNFSTVPVVMICALGEDFVNGGTQINKGTVGTGTVTFDVSAASKQKLTVSGALAIAYSNWSVSGTYSEVEIELVNGGTNITWPTVKWMKGDGTSSTTFSDMGVTLATAGTNFVITWSTDGGTTLYGKAV